MATHLGKEGSIASGANTVAEVKSYRIEETANTTDTTPLGTTAETHAITTTNWTASVEAFWDETDATGQGTFTIGASVTLNVYPEGDTSGDTFYTGTALITGLTVSAANDGTVDATFELRGTGALTKGTVA